MGCRIHLRVLSPLHLALVQLVHPMLWSGISAGLQSENIWSAYIVCGCQAIQVTDLLGFSGLHQGSWFQHFVLGGFCRVWLSSWLCQWRRVQLCLKIKYDPCWHAQIWMPDGNCLDKAYLRYSATAVQEFIGIMIGIEVKYLNGSSEAPTNLKVV